MNQQIVYWANLTSYPRDLVTPVPLVADIAQSQNEHAQQNHVACPAIRSKHRNTFMTKIPHDFSINFYPSHLEMSAMGLSPRPGLYKDSYAFDLDFCRIFFCSEPQSMEVSPAFLHKTSYSQYGHAPSGAFDIGQWFRPSAPTFQLWSGETHFSAKEGEPHLYFNFPNEKKVVLQEFSMTNALYQAMNYCLQYKVHKPKQSLQTMYADFIQDGVRDKVLDEIKKNLINAS